MNSHHNKKEYPRLPLTSYMKFVRGFVYSCENILNPETRLHTLLKNLTRKVVALTLIIGLNASALSTIGDTFSYYNDTEESVGNIFTATSLDFSLTSEGDTKESFRTQTQGGWGSPAHGDNPGSYRDAHFDDAFPDGVTIGDLIGFTAAFTSSSAVEDFLPEGQTSNPFTQDHIDPSSTEAGVLAGQTLALSLNVGFDAFDPDFAPSPNLLSNYVLPGGSCVGMTVGEVLAEANKVLGGTSTSTTPSDINDCADFINNLFIPNETPLSEGPVVKTFILQKDGVLNFKYTVFATSTEEVACDNFSVEAKLDENSVYNGPLTDLALGPFVYENPETWEFTFNEEDISGICDFEIEFLGWQENFSIFGGYSDSEKHPISLGTEEEPEPELSTLSLLTIGESADTDTEAPVITILGNNPAVIALGETYNDLGALVTDNVNNNLGITTEGASIDTGTTGVFEVIYSATDQAGNTTTASRTVVVYDPKDGDPDLSVYTQNKIVEIVETEEVPLEDISLKTEGTYQELVENSTGGESTTVIEEEITENTATSTEDIIKTTLDEIVVDPAPEEISTTTEETVLETEETSATPENLDTNTGEATQQETPAKEEEISALISRDEEENSDTDESPAVLGDDPPEGPLLVEDIISPDTFVTE